VACAVRERWRLGFDSQVMDLNRNVPTTRQCEKETREPPQVAGENLTTEGHARSRALNLRATAGSCTFR